MTQHQNNVGYFRMMASKAKTLAHRIYWLGRAVGKEEADKARAADAEAKRKIAEREANLNAFKNLPAPDVKIVSKWPNGCIVSWSKPEWDREPDTYQVLVRDYGTIAWRSVASSNIDRDTTSQVLTNSFLAWDTPAEQYEIKVAAVRNGVGVKDSDIMIYPHQKPTETKEVEQKPYKQQAFVSRDSEIIAAIRTYTGRRTRKGRPYIGDFRKHLELDPKVKYSELRKHWKMLHNAPTGD